MEISLAGKWRVALDPRGEFDPSKLPSLPVQEAILPGSLDENEIGEVNDEQGYMGGLSRRFTYVGPAWYTREVSVPVELRSRRVVLELERCHWFSELWIDGQPMGRRDSLSVAHRYALDLPDAASVSITIRVDNTPRIAIGRIGHALTDWTQTNWNGIIGAMTIRPVSGEFGVDRVLRTEGGFLIEGRSPHAVECRSALSDRAYLVAQDAEEFRIEIPRQDLVEWSDEHPALNKVVLTSGDETHLVTLGTREFVIEGRFFKLNDHLVFLRGTLDCCAFPKTGYPAMMTEAWRAIFRTIKEFGLNHVRFHSWCPPEAAFAAADEIGVLLQVECPLWTGHTSLSSDPELLSFIAAEAERILEAYAHHPSFALFCLGNEMAFYGEEPSVDELLLGLKAKYPHILFNFSSHGTHLSKACDYYVQADNGKPGAENEPLRGSTWFGVGSRFDREAPGSVTDCRKAASQFDRPVIAHEVGEWAVYPDLSEIPMYGGVLEARNFQKIASQLEERGMGGQAADFTQASGRLSANLYKEEIETLLRTPDLAGYQLLGLADFPGQGTATIGMLNAFWESKGFVSADEFRQWASPTVPLLSLSKFVWTHDETLSGEVRVAHSGEETEGEVTWFILDESGQCLRSGSLGTHRIQALAENSVGNLEIPLGDLPASAKYSLRLRVNGAQNSWAIWVFPKAPVINDVRSARIFDGYPAAAREAIVKAEKVWLRLNPSRSHFGIPGRFAPAFWSPIHFVEQVGTLGTVIQADHAVFAQFPTDGHSDWHWWEILLKSQAINLNDFPADFRPLLQVIDRYERNHKLGTIFEAKIGDASVLVTCIDFETPGRPVAQQLEQSIRGYLESADFDPSAQITLALLDRLFRHQP